jgi:Domain of unknown function (DUF5667)
MNEDTEMDDRTGHDEVERRLRAYADARLSPSAEASGRMRTAVVARPAATGLRSLPWLLRSRRAAALLLAATMAAGSAAAVFAATPGSPLYSTRLWFESLSLPASGDARSAAQVGDLAQRLAEAQTAVNDGDSNAVAAALTAFNDELAAALRDAGNDPTRLAQLEAALAQHVADLRALEAGAPPQSVAAIEAAIAASTKAVQVIEAQAHQPATHPTPAPPTPPANRPTPRPPHT